VRAPETYSAAEISAVTGASVRAVYKAMGERLPRGLSVQRDRQGREHLIDALAPYRVNVRVVQTRLEVRPRIPAVEAAKDAVNFDRRPDNAVIVGVDDDGGHEGYANRTLRGDLYRQFFPVQSAISRAIDPSRARAGKENVGVNRVNGQRPYRRHRPTGADPLPPCSAIVAREQARIAAR